MQANDSSNVSGWTSALSRSVAAVFLFELVSGLAVTFGPFHPVVEWGLIFHTALGVLAVAPLCLVLLPALEDVPDPGDVGCAAARICGRMRSERLCCCQDSLLTGQALFGIRDAGPGCATCT